MEIGESYSLVAKVLSQRWWPLTCTGITGHWVHLEETNQRQSDSPAKEYCSCGGLTLKNIETHQKI